MTNNGVWGLAEAKARFSEVIDRALLDGPQTITRKGREAVVVVSPAEWKRKTKRKGNLAEFFAAPRCAARAYGFNGPKMGHAR
jgi:prevent-host-death family protein